MDISDVPVSSTRADNVYSLLHPEKLSQQELFIILRTLCVSVSENTSREYLLKLFNRVALPLPQRKIKRNFGCTTNIDVQMKDYTQTGVSNESLAVTDNGDCILAKEFSEKVSLKRFGPILTENDFKRLKPNIVL